MNILLFGPPGAGKGTQSALLVERLNMKHISTGDLFRYHMREMTPLGKVAKGFVDNGNLVPDDLVIKMVDDVLLGLGSGSFILDGFPRTLTQAVALDKSLSIKNLNVSKAIFIEVPREILLERLAGRRVCKNCGATYHVKYLPPKAIGICDNCGGEVIQRKDDSQGVVEGRLDSYDSTTAPLKEYFRDNGKLRIINGVGSTEGIFEAIKTELSFSKKN